MFLFSYCVDVFCLVMTKVCVSFPHLETDLAAYLDFVFFLCMCVFLCSCVSSSEYHDL